MKLTVTIEITDSVYRGLVAESQRRGLSVSQRIGECIVECVPELKHRHADDWVRYGLKEMPLEDYTEVRRRVVLHRKKFEEGINRYFIQMQLAAEGIRPVQQKFEF